MAAEWEIKSRAEQCSATGRSFADGESFYTLLYRERAAFRREDLCEEAFQERSKQWEEDKRKSAPAKPFSFWRSKFEPPAPPAPETLAKETAEDLLRRYIEEDEPQHANTRYILALMLERKRLLKQTDVQQDGNERILIYERVKTGEVFVIRDPQLHMEQIESVQGQVADLLK